jgi:(p)ppGpp synthase/HD superfamily hydrolase
MSGVILIERARQLAGTAHHGQFDKSGEPYLGHVRRVAERVEKRGGNPTQIAAAWAHDVVEDTPTSLKMLALVLGHEVAFLVEALTHRRHEPRAEYYQRILEVPDAVLVKLADIDDNTSPERLARLDVATRARLETKYETALRILQEEK